MKNPIARRRDPRPADCRKLLTRNGAGVETLRREHLGRYLPAHRPSSKDAATTTPYYEYQYGYDKHAAWRGHWVLIR